ncbi:cytochrome b5 [Apiospora arundinis]
MSAPEEIPLPASPISPWRKEYGPSMYGDLGDGTEHSLLNPVFPRLDPVHYDDLPDPKVTNPTNLDELFFNRQIQHDDLHVYSYQLGPLNEYLGGPVRGGHSAGYDHQENRDRHKARLLNVNENNWLDCFRQDRWWALSEEPLIDESRDDPIRTWDPRSPRIWAELRVILEFCNWTVAALLEERDPWMDALLFGDLLRADGTPVPLKSNPSDGPFPTNDGTYVIRYRRPDDMPSRKDYFYLAHGRLRQCTEYLIWGFRDERSWKTQQSNTKTTTPHGVTSEVFLMEDPEIQTQLKRPMIWLDVAEMRLLLERDPEPADASLARVHLAEVILHEFVHAIHAARRQEYRFSANDTVEPYMGEEQIQELGQSFTYHIFGGLKYASLLPATPPGELHGQIVAMTDRVHFPAASSFASYNQEPRDGWDLVPYGKDVAPRWIIPAFFCSSVFDQNYWDIVVNKKGTNALKHPRIAWVPRPEAWAVDKDIPVLEPRVDEFRPMLKRVQDAMVARTREVEERETSRNPDKARIERIWKQTLWGKTQLRKWINQFHRWHRREDLESCREIAHTLAGEARRAMDTLGNRKAPSDMISRTGCWVMIVIGNLMMASLPAQTLRAGNTRNTVRRQIWWGPRDTDIVGRRFGRIWPGKEFRVQSADGRTTSQLWHPRQYVTIAKEILDTKLASTHLSWIEGVQNPWINACFRLCNDLWERRPLGCDPKSFTEFAFKIPPFTVDQTISSLGKALRAPKEGPADYAGKVIPAERFLTPSEVAEDNLVLVRTANTEGWSCYAVPESIADTMQDFTVLTMCGWALPYDNEVAGVSSVRAELRKKRPQGVLIPWYRLTEVAEFDGTLSVPLWRVHKRRVYNITNFLRDNPNISRADRDVVEGPHAADGSIPVDLDASLLTDELQASLRPYQCAFVKPDNQDTTKFAVENELVMTEKELACFDTPDSGVYVSYKNIIYNITDYLEHHPGAYHILAKYGGRDITEVFDKGHGGIALTELDMRHVKCTISKVGRLVKTATTVGRDQLVLGGYLFRLTNLSMGDAVRARWAGKVVTPQDWTESRDAPLFDALFSRRGTAALAKYEPAPSILGAFKSSTAPQITPQTLADYDASTKSGAWIAVPDGVFGLAVYDISGLIRHPRCFPDYPNSINDLQAQAGRPIYDRTLAEWFRNNLAHRNLGRLSEGMDLKSTFSSML